jgi:predicted metal-dependent phosphoesterase TrpH
MTVLRADLHVHTCYSRHNGDLPFLGSRDCYSPPEAVYRVARARGMDLVAITDHDTIDGALTLVERRPDARDIIVGEEVSCWLPDSGIEVHLGVYGMTESLHRDLQPLRPNAFDVIERLREAAVCFALNHLLHSYDTRVAIEDYLRLLDAVPALEVRNGTMLAAHNRLLEDLAVAWPGPVSRLAVVAGSDAHTLRRVGTTWTEAPGRDADEFLSNVRAGLGRPAGRHGGALAIAGDAYGVIGRFMASVSGVGPRDHHGWRRAGCLGFCLGSLPFQFLPVAIAARGKARERRKVRALAEWMAAEPLAARFEAVDMVRAEP